MKQNNYKASVSLYKYIHSVTCVNILVYDIHIYIHSVHVTTSLTYIHIYIYIYTLNYITYIYTYTCNLGNRESNRKTDGTPSKLIEYWILYNIEALVKLSCSSTETVQKSFTKKLN